MENEGKTKRNSLGKASNHNHPNDAKSKKSKKQPKESQEIPEEPKQEQPEEKKMQKSFRDIYMEEATEIFGEELDQLRRVLSTTE